MICQYVPEEYAYILLDSKGVKKMHYEERFLTCVFVFVYVCV